MINRGDIKLAIDMVVNAQDDNLFGGEAEYVINTLEDCGNTIAAQAAVIDRLKSALKDCYVEFFYVNQQLNGVLDEDGEPLYREGKSVTSALAKGKEALAIPTDSTQILDEVRRAERELVYQVADNAYATEHVLLAIRAME